MNPTRIARTVFTWLLLVVFGQVVADQPDIPTPRQLFQLYGIDDSQIDFFVHGSPISDVEREVLQRLLFRISKIPLELVDTWSGPPNIDSLLNAPDDEQTKFFQVVGQLKTASRIALPVELSSTLRFDHYFVVTLQIDKGVNVIVFARTIPKVWETLLDQELSTRATIQGVFLKQTIGEDGRPALLFVANRVAWMPEVENPDLGISRTEAFLGSLQMDLGLFDTVRDRTPLKSTDRECFYQLLAAVGRAERSRLNELANNEVNLSQLLTAPTQERGHVHSFVGTVRRAVRIEVSDLDIRQRFGIDHYFEMEVFIALDHPVRLVAQKGDEQGKLFSTYPVVFCVRRLPDNCPTGEINVRAKVDGVYFKVWAYQSPFINSSISGDEGAKRRLQISPLFIGVEPSLVIDQQKSGNFTGAIVGGSLGLLIIVGTIWLFRQQLSFRRYRREKTT